MHKPRERANEEGVRELNVAQPKEKKKKMEGKKQARVETAVLRSREEPD